MNPLKYITLLIVLGLISMIIMLFNNCTTYSSVRDADGNRYKTVKIGDKEWMAESLKTTRFNDGSGIILEKDTVKWMNKTAPAYCWFKNNGIIYGKNYGAFYNWFAVESKKLCPAGWHVPSEAEWESLLQMAGGYDHGNKLKAKEYDYWKFPNTDANDRFHFEARGSGYRDAKGEFAHLYEKVFFWTSTTAGTGKAWAYGLSFDKKEMERVAKEKTNGFSVRCVKD